MTPTIRRDFAATNDVLDGERAVVATINTDGVDRFGTVILPEGAVLGPYRKNPVVLAEHDQEKTPIGRNLWIKVQRDRLVAKTQFLPEGVDPLADKIFRLYQLGFLLGWSVHGLPISYGRPTAEEVRRRPDWSGAKAVYRKWELLEYSAVTVPGNAAAITEAVSRGLGLPGWKAPAPFPGNTPAPVPTLPPLVARSFDQVLQATIRQARAELQTVGRRAVRDAEELARGMV